MNPNPDKSGLKPPWKKGEPSPNPSGRPRRLPISDAHAERALQPVPASIRESLERAGITLAADATCADAVAAQLSLRAMNGDVAAAREIRESSEGRAGQRIGPAAAGPVEIKIRYEDGSDPTKDPEFRDAWRPRQEEPNS